MSKIYYFDYAATTPLDKRVFAVMKPYFSDKYGNPSNLYSVGREAKGAIDEALKKIGLIARCSSQEFIFTASATEADNLALIGTARANKDKGKRIIISALEHKGVSEACEALKKEGFEIVELGSDKNSQITASNLLKILDKKTILVSVVYADNETGTTQPLKELTKTIRLYRSENKTPFPYFHTDASQAAGYLNINAQDLGVDLMTLSAHKIYGPKGIAGLFVRRNVPMRPMIHGGGQQNNLRSGTENVPGIVGFAEALIIANKMKEKESERIKKLRDKLEAGILKSIDKVMVNGNPDKRLPNFLNVSVLDIEGEAALLYLDQKGIIVNTGSACNSRSLEPSKILQAMGLPYEYIHGSIRFTLGRGTKDADIGYVLKELPGIVKKLRAMSPLKLKIDGRKELAEPKAFVRGKPHFLKKDKA